MSNVCGVPTPVGVPKTVFVMLNSSYADLGPITFPPYRARQKYMHTFDLSNPNMAEGFEDYQPLVVELCQRARVFSGEAHMTVDEKLLLVGQTQRRPGPHVDGCFVPAIGKWGHDPGGGWLHGCNNVGRKLGRMPVIVAASEIGCKAYPGIIDGEPTSDGDTSHLTLPTGKFLHPNRGFLLSADCVHESLPALRNICRSFLRIALPING